MATGNEIWLGGSCDFYWKHAPPDAPRLPTCEELDDPESSGDELREFGAAFEAYADGYRTRLLRAWYDAIAAVGWTPDVSFDHAREQRDKPAFPGPIDVSTPVGPRQMYPFVLRADHCDAMGYEPPEMPFGVALSGRYRPTFLDYRDESGAIPPVLPIWDEEYFSMIAIARPLIVRVLPWLAEAKICVVEQFY